MAAFALIDTRSPSAVIRRQAFASAPQLAAAKGLKWIPDNPPSYDPAKQTRAEAATVPVDAAEVPYTVSAIPLAEVKAARKAALAARRYTAETGGITVGGAGIATDRDSQATITGAKAAVDDGLVTPPINWKAAGGFVQIDAPTLAAIAGAVAAHVQDCFTNEATISAAIDACQTADDVLAIDIEAGWPE